MSARRIFARPARIAAIAPYLWLVLFFLVPIITSVSASVQTGNFDDGFKLTWHWDNYRQALTPFWHQYLHSGKIGRAHV